MCWLQTIQLLWTWAIAERGHIDQADDLQDQVGRRNGVPTGLPAPAKPSCPRRQGGLRHDHTDHRDRRHHAPHHAGQAGPGAAITRAAEGLAVDGQAGRALTIALDVEPLAIEANRMLQGLTISSREAGEEQDDAGS
jgi:hypothetical protein